MNATEAVIRAAEEPTLAKALSWICVWECERAIRQATKNPQWETCFEYCIKAVMEAWEARSTIAAPAQEDNSVLRPGKAREAYLLRMLLDCFKQLGVGDGTRGWIEHADEDEILKRDTLSFEGELTLGFEAIHELIAGLKVVAFAPPSTIAPIVPEGFVPVPSDLILPNEPVRKQYDRSASNTKFGECDACGDRRNLVGLGSEFVCGCCLDADHLQAWKDYADQLRAIASQSAVPAQAQEPLKWTVAHNGKSVTADSLFKAMKAAQALRTDGEAQIAAENLMRAVAEELAQEMEMQPLMKRCYTLSERHLSGYRLILGFETLDAVQAAHTYVSQLDLKGDGTDERAAPAQAPQAVRDGWALVPEEPTPEMMQAAWDTANELWRTPEADDPLPGHQYRAMLAAAPKPDA